LPDAGPLRDRRRSRGNALADIQGGEGARLGDHHASPGRTGRSVVQEPVGDGNRFYAGRKHRTNIGRSLCQAVVPAVALMLRRARIVSDLGVHWRPPPNG